MNDQWLKKDGTRWNSAEKDRATRLFRAHVDTPSNRRKGRSCRIRREPCWFCLQNARQGGFPQEEHLSLESFHHIDYSKPFRGIWACTKHHRQIDHGALRIPLKAVRDYTSDVEVVARHGLRHEGPRHGRRKDWSPRKKWNNQDRKAAGLPPF